MVYCVCLLTLWALCFDLIRHKSIGEDLYDSVLDSMSTLLCH